MMNWLDRVVQSVADYLARRVSPRGWLAVAGANAAGFRIYSHLPVDRRGHEEHRHSMVGGSDDRRLLMAGPPTPVGPPFPATPVMACSDSRYCNMHGRACLCCGGTDVDCPLGTVKGHYWSYCCDHRMIWFIDCCGGTKKCPSSCPWCDNSVQPNWCLSAGKSIYTCTLAEDKGAC